MAGPVADAVGVRPWFVVGGAITSIMGLVAFFVPVIVNIEEDPRRRLTAEGSLPAGILAPVSVEAVQNHE